MHSVGMHSRGCACLVTQDGSLFRNGRHLEPRTGQRGSHRPGPEQPVMMSAASSAGARRPFIPFNGTWPRAAIVAIAYFIGAEAAFLVGTLSDKVFAPFWPPNVILFCALLLTPKRQWWVYIAAAFPAHIVAELGVGMPMPQLLVAFATNCLVAMLNALLVQAALGEGPWFGSLKRAALYILLTAIAGSAVAALGGAFVPILGGGSVHSYFVFWEQWYLSNALGFLTLGPIFLIWLGEGAKSLSSIALRPLLEGALLTIALVVACVLAFRVSSGTVSIADMPAVLYSPLPIILWSAIRFGEKGASGATLVVTVVLLWLSLNSSSLFTAGSQEANVFALQIFLASLSTPLLLLGASIDEARDAIRTTRESEERMSFAAASTNVGLWHLEPTGRLWATDHCRSMLGVPPGAPLTRTTIMEAIHPDDRQATAESIESAAHSGEETSAEFRVVSADGHVRWFRARARSDRDKQGKPCRVSGIFLDITARKEAQHEAELQRRELAHLMRVSVMGQLSGAIAHELNQPLASILSNAEAVQIMLQGQAPNLAEMGEAVSDIVSADERASEIIDHLRRLLRKDEGKLGPIDFKDLVASTLRLLHSEIISRRIKVTTNLAEDLPPVWGDGVQLQQVLLNLIMNAMDALASAPSAQGVITVSTRRLNDDQIETAVSDLGHGLNPQAEGRAFEPFFTTKPHGLGLGLSICSTIINLHGGTLQLTNNTDGGARATFTLRIKHVVIPAGA